MEAELIRAFVADAPGQTFHSQLVPLAAIGESDVEVAVTACALCHSDLHLWRGDWAAAFPLVPGHEIVGRIVAAGSTVSGFSIGDRVGIGWQSGACFDCEQCRAGLPHLCAVAKVRTCVNRHGGFADRVVADHRFVYRIPPGMGDAQAAPLMCAGLTVFSPLRRLGVAAGSRVAIVGFGGLGHLAVQFANALGATVTAFDPDEEKRSDAMICGAHRFSTVLGATSSVAPQPEFDLILTTTHAPLEWNYWLSQLRIGGALCLLGVPSGLVGVDANLLLDGQRVLTGSVVGSPDCMRDMLAFAERHAVQPWTELMSFSDVNRAMRRLEEGAVRYRVVLTHAATRSS